MKLSKLLWPIISVYVLVFVYAYVVHGYLLVDIYRQTPQLWRSPEDMSAYFPVMLISEIAFSIIFTLGYAFLQEKLSGALKGWQYGLGMGAAFAAIQFGVYAYMPISLTLAILWAVDALVEPVLCGVLISCLYKK
jgi:hypothetical protein